MISFSSSSPSSLSSTVEPLTQIYIDMGFTNIKSHIILPKITGSLSILGSTYIIQDVLRTPSKWSKSTYHRIMVGLSTLDILVSLLSHFLTSWPMPRGYYMMAIGSVASCDYVAFVACIGHFGIPLYNCSLVTYYLLELKYNWAERRIKDVEKWLHIVPWASGFVFATVGLMSQSFGPILSVCWITTTYPFYCRNGIHKIHGLSIEEEEDLPQCIRGANKTLTALLKTSYFFLQIGTIIYVSVGMTIVYKKIRSIEKNAQKFSFTSNFMQAKNKANDSSITTSISMAKIPEENSLSTKNLKSKYFKMKQKMTRRSRWIMIQGILYSAVLILTLIFPMIGILYYIFTGETLSIIDLLLTIFFPLQGFFNAMIYAIPYFRKRYNEMKQEKKKRMIKLMDVQKEEEGSKDGNYDNLSFATEKEHRRVMNRRIPSKRFSVRSLSLHHKWWEGFEITNPSPHEDVIHSHSSLRGRQSSSSSSSSRRSRSENCNVKDELPFKLLIPEPLSYDVNFKDNRNDDKDQVDDIEHYGDCLEQKDTNMHGSSTSSLMENVSFPLNNVSLNYHEAKAENENAFGDNQNEELIVLNRIYDHDSNSESSSSLDSINCNVTRMRSSEIKADQELDGDEIHEDTSESSKKKLRQSTLFYNDDGDGDNFYGYKNRGKNSPLSLLHNDNIDSNHGWR